MNWVTMNNDMYIFFQGREESSIVAEVCAGNQP